MRKVALLLVAAPLALAACGSSSKAQVKLDPLAYVKHSAQKTSQTSEHMTMTAKMDMGGMSFTLGGSGDFSSNPLQGSFALHMNLLGHSVKIDEVINDTTIYMHSPATSQGLGRGKRWMKLDLAQAASHMHLDISTLMSRDPAQAIRQLEAAGTVTQVGTETLDGVATTHYRVTNLDISKLALGSKIGALVHPKYGPINVWIGNSDGYVYRETMSVSYSVSTFSGTHAISMTMAVNLSKFGEAVHVSVPPASQTIDTSNLPMAASG